MVPITAAEKGMRGKVSGWHYYLEDGYLTIEDRDENIFIMINGQVIADTGNVDASDDLQNSFPDLTGSNALFRKLNVSTYGNFYDTVDFRIGVDFANVRDIQDIWIRYLKDPYLKNVKIGHLKEPFSLEYLTSLTRLTFMERSLPDSAFGAGRNIGIRYDSQDNSKPVNFGLGFFLNTGSFSDFGEAQNQISEANGFDTTLRVFGLPRYKLGGKQLLHLGLGYSLGMRDENNTSAPMEFRTRPESRLTDERLVNTGPIQGANQGMATAELALVSGPWSFQTQGYYLALNADEVGDPHFWGYYAFLSTFLTGQCRNYNPALGIFTGVDPQPAFNPAKGDWGAWEVALRHSYVDLNDSNVKGGCESNITAGLNWIHNRNIRMMFNYINAYVKDRESPAIKDGTAHIFQVRFQFIW
jgi:phosphate-selective porin OprO/OprP